MAGQGMAPTNDPGRLTGHGAAKSRDNILRIVPAKPCPQPDLPDFTVQIEKDGTLVEQTFVWPQITRDWWAMWGEHPTAAEYGASDWSFLLDTARLHARFWAGDEKCAGELRLRVAKFGATPEDRARLRIQFAVANQKDNPTAPPTAGGSGNRRKLTGA